jgi:hypothetical protein
MFLFFPQLHFKLSYCDFPIIKRKMGNCVVGEAENPAKGNSDQSSVVKYSIPEGAMRSLR